MPKAPKRVQREPLFLKNQLEKIEIQQQQKDKEQAELASRAQPSNFDALGLSFAQNANNQNYAHKSQMENISMDSPQMGIDPLNQLEDDEQDDLGLGDYSNHQAQI